MSKLDAKVFSSITPFSKQWILGDELMYEFLYNYQEFLSDSYGIVDLGSLTWTFRAAGGAIRNDTFQSTTLKDIVQRTSGRADAYCTKYDIASWNQVGFQDYDKVISIASDGFINVGDSDAGTDPDAFKAAMSGVYLIYKLADNIGRVNMGSLSWQLQTYTIGGAQRNRFASNIISDISAATPLLNLYTPKYTPSRVPTTDLGTDKTICGYDKKLYVIDWDYATAEAFKASLANTYLYYEKA